MKKCENCNKEHDESYGSGRFCSKKCANSRGKRSEETKQKISIGIKTSKKFQDAMKLKIGKKHIISTQSRLKQSNSLKKYYQEKNIKIMETKEFHEWPKRLIYETLFTKRGNACEECGYEYIDEKTKKGPFEIHHIDGDNKNWKKDNLKILCLNCHWKTSNWRGRNNKKTRDSIEKMLKTKLELGQIKNIKYIKK